MRPTADVIRAFLYTRSASKSQIGPNKQVDEQLECLRAYAQHRSYVIVGEACDAGQSGNKLSRPGLTVVMEGATCTPPAFDVLLATDPTRLARDAGLFTALVSRLTAAGVKFESANNFHLTPHANEILKATLRNSLRRPLVGQDEED
jgi:DNA invertase Pin-like site-specific DNA recombinase